MFSLIWHQILSGPSFKYFLLQCHFDSRLKVMKEIVICCSCSSVFFLSVRAKEVGAMLLFWSFLNNLRTWLVFRSLLRKHSTLPNSLPKHFSTKYHDLCKPQAKIHLPAAAHRLAAVKLCSQSTEGKGKALYGKVMDVACFQGCSSVHRLIIFWTVLTAPELRSPVVFCSQAEQVPKQHLLTVTQGTMSFTWLI